MELHAVTSTVHCARFANFMRATTNPGGRGHHWVKKMFIDPSPYDRAFDATDIETTEVLRYPAGHSKAGKPLFKRRFIPARLSDNPYLAQQVITKPCSITSRAAA